MYGGWDSPKKGANKNDHWGARGIYPVVWFKTKQGKTFKKEYYNRTTAAKAIKALRKSGVEVVKTWRVQY